MTLRLYDLEIPLLRQFDWAVYFSRLRRSSNFTPTPQMTLIPSLWRVKMWLELTAPGATRMHWVYPPSIFLDLIALTAHRRLRGLHLSRTTECPCLRTWCCVRNQTFSFSKAWRSLMNTRSATFALMPGDSGQPISRCRWTWRGSSLAFNCRACVYALWRTQHVRLFSAAHIPRHSTFQAP